MVLEHEPARVRLKARKLHAVIARSRWSQNGWAQRIGVSPAYLSQLVRGTRCYPSSDVRRKLLQATGLRFDALFEIEHGLRPDRLLAFRLGRWVFRVERNPTPRLLNREERLLMDGIRQDFRYALRMIRRQPVLTAVAALTLALGIGANATIFTFAKALFMVEPQVADADRVIRVYGTAENEATDTGFNPISWPNYRDLREQTGSFAELAAFTFLQVGLSDGKGEARFETAKLVSGNYFEALGVRASLGRSLGVADEEPLGAHPVAVISDFLWRDHFAGDPEVIGRSVLINGHSFTVVGVMPAGFQGIETLFATRVWLPISMHPQTFTYSRFVEARRWRIFSLVGRLADGVTEAQAAADLRTVAARLEQEFPEDNLHRSTNTLPVALSGIAPQQRAFFVQASWLLFAVVALVLLITCANLANLMITRGRTRAREIALRLSLGASRRRVTRQLLSESLLLAILGGALAIPVTVLGRNLLWANRPGFVGDSVDASLDARVVAFTALLAVAAGVLFGLIPALQSTRTDLSRSLQQRSPTDASGSRTPVLFRDALVLLQVSLSFVAVVGAGLFLGSLRQAQRIDPGFDLDRLLQVPFDMISLGYDESRGREFQDLVVRQLEALPEVERAAVAQVAPLSFALLARTTIREGDPDDAAVLVETNAVGPGYFAATGIPLRSGREFAVEDGPDSRGVIVVNEVMAERLWPGADPIAQRVRFLGERQQYEVVGVAGEIKYTTLGEAPKPVFYHPIAQRYSPGGVILARTRVEPAELVERVRATVRAIEPALPLGGIVPATTNLELTLATPRMAASVLSVFGALALTLAAVGIYGVLAQIVAQRRREIGIRLAIGAGRSDVLRMVVGQTLRWVAVGGVIGAGIIFVLGRGLAAFLYGMRPTDPWTLTGTFAVLAGAALVAASVPARRASRVDPATALREE